MRMLLLSLIPALLGAADPLVFEARLTGGITPGITGFDTDITAPGGSTSSHDNADATVGGALELQAVISRRFTPLLGFGGSVGVFFRRHQGNDPTSTDTVAVSAFGLDLAPTLNLHLDDRMWIEVGPTLGIGSGRREIRVNGTEDPTYPDGSGLYTSYGARAGFYLLLREHVIIGADVGFLSFTNNDSVDVSGVTIDTTTKGSGFAANACVGYRF